MGQKVNPTGLRLALTRGWNSCWYSDKKGYSAHVLEDEIIRKIIKEECASFGISKVVIQRATNNVFVEMHTGKPGMLVGKEGENLEQLKAKISKKLRPGINLIPCVNGVQKPELDAHIVAHNIATQIEKRVSYRRAINRAMQSALKLGAGGIKVKISGRINGAEIARSEWYMDGRVPLHTLRSNIDYASDIASTTYGVCGIKVWIYKGESKGELDTKSTPSGDKNNGGR